MILKPIPNAPGYYAGEDGNIYGNLPIGKSKIGKLRQLKPGIQSTGKYYVVSVKKDGIRKTHRVHRLICETFHGTPSDTKLTVSHLDGNWKNNIPSNLKWESYSDNLNHKKEHGTDDNGYKNSRAKINKEQLLLIRKLLSEKELTHKQIGNIFNVSRVFITKIANRYRYKYD